MKNTYSLLKNVVTSGILLIILGAFSYVKAEYNASDLDKNHTTQKTKVPKWQLGAGLFYGLTPHYPASNHIYEIASPAPLFIYRFEKATLKRREIITPINDKTRFAITFGLSAPVGKNNRSANEFSKNAANANKRVVTEDNFHRRGMDGIPTIFKLGGQIAYQPNPHLDLKFPLFFNLGLKSIDNIDYQGYELHPEISVSLKPNADRSRQNGFNVVGSVEIRYGDATINRLYYQVNADDVIDGRARYNAKAGEYSRSYRIALGYQHRFNYDDSIQVFLSFRHQDYSHSANTQSPLHIVNSNNTIATGFSYYFYSSKNTVTR